MNFIISDEHNPIVQRFGIYAEGVQHASNVSPEFAELFLSMAAALIEIKAKDGMCIYGTAKLHDEPQESKEWFREGSALASVEYGAKLTERKTEVTV